MKTRYAPALFVASAIFTSSVHAVWIPTNQGIGADAEVRESAPTENRGSNTELASRVKNEVPLGNSIDGQDRNSAIYVKFDLAGVSMPTNLETAFRLTYRNPDLIGSRVQDTVTSNPGIRTGLAIYGLNPAASGANWDESTITYLTAPGITFDGDVGTKDFNSDLTFLGSVAFPEIGSQNHLPVGGQLIFRSPNLDQFVTGVFARANTNVFGNGHTPLTLVVTLIHGGDTPFTNWINFNYAFNPKEQTTLNADNYDPDGSGSVGNLYGTNNSTGAFSPALLIQTKAQPALITGIVADAGTVELTVSNATPRIVTNTVERTQSLSPGNWTEVGGYPSGPGVTNWSEPTPSGYDRAFYRIQTE